MPKLCIFNDGYVFFVFRSHVLKSVLAHASKSNLCWCLSATPVFPFPEMFNWAVFCHRTRRTTLLSFVATLSGACRHHEAVFFLKVLVGFCSNIGVTGRPSCLQLNCALASDKNPVKMKDEQYGVRCTGSILHSTPHVGERAIQLIGSFRRPPCFAHEGRKPNMTCVAQIWSGTVHNPYYAVNLRRML